MTHKRWTEQYDGAFQFLAAEIPLYLKCQEEKKPLKDGFYPDMTQKFKEKYPQVPSAAEVRKYGQEDAERMVDKRLLDVSSCLRIHHWKRT